jgi:hypothetical protein
LIENLFVTTTQNGINIIYFSEIELQNDVVSES